MGLFDSLKKKKKPAGKDKEQLLSQLKAWHEAGEYGHIIEAIEALPADELDYELTSWLARAYNNKGNNSDDGEQYLAKGLALLQGVETEGRNDPYWHFRVGYSLLDLEREEEAVPYLERVLKMPKSKAVCDDLDADAETLLKDCRPIAEFLKNPTAQEQAYYEKKSVMVAIPPKELGDDATLTGIPEKIAAIEGVEMLPLHDEEQGEAMLRIRHEDEEYPLIFYFVPVQIAYNGWKVRQEFTEQEMKQATDARMGLAVDMPFGSDYMTSYHLQLKIMDAVMPDAVAVFDESGEQLLLGRWVRLAAESAVPPPSDMMYVLQAVSDDKDEVWMHTHGLARCHVPELEILGANVDNYKPMGDLLNATARYILGNNDAAKPYEGICVGAIDDETPLVVTLVPWEEAIKRFPEHLNGGKYDRKYDHHSYSAAIYCYPSKEAEKQHDYRHISRLSKKLSTNGLYFYTKRETDYMHQRAQERLGIMLDIARKTPENAIVKLGFLTDDAAKEGTEEREHIWFEIVAITSATTFMAKCTNTPVWVSSLKNGDIGTYSTDIITDWRVYVGDQTLSPDDAYML
ncbi:DUF4026 domain-containing protein [Prevotella sp. kh1p2]|uniref:DUF4026 domain-containing protein n=1 Tax=Prevotella sp. kh1p2 TaxID=1761883 RepID=UPI0008D66E2C|nr:DUF4026 domain-containing protein [Prevotella sp. kh1p2]SES94852.1 hypothetical protein SAMN04487825_10911 [Prevotella sp. kh1p2]